LCSLVTGSGFEPYQIVVAEIELHEAGKRFQGVADVDNDIQAEVEALERGQVLEGVLLDVGDAVVVEVDHLQVDQPPEALLVDGLTSMLLNLLSSSSLMKRLNKMECLSLANFFSLSKVRAYPSEALVGSWPDQKCK
jgi:hypothetical protein